VARIIAIVACLMFVAAPLAQTPPPAGRAGQTPPPTQTGQTPPTTELQTPIFRAGTVLVPIDVRVIDRRTGRPVTDLTQNEFIVTESNARQQIRHFSAQGLVPDESTQPAPLVRANVAPTTLSPQKRRTFLIVLGRGRLQPVTKAVDGMLYLVKERLLPQDYVAVMAFNRATEFTTDHKRIAAMLERYLKDHEKVEALMAQRFAGLTAAYGGSYIPKAIQTQIDAIFRGPNNAAVRSIPDTAPANATRMANDQRQISDALMSNEINATREPGTFLTDPMNEMTGVEMSFDEYVTANAQTSQDLTKIYAGINYMRYLDGEKHLVFVTENGLMLPRAEDDTGLAATAEDARVAIDIMHTGGTAPLMMARGGGAAAAGGGGGGGAARGGGAGAPARAGGGGGGGARGGDAGARAGGGGGRGDGGGRGGGRGGFAATGPDWRITTSSTIANRTGGKFASALKGKDFVDQLDAATRFSYLLGYYPTNNNWNGQYRKVNVQITRQPRGAYIVQFRHGYMANLELRPLDKPKALAYTRVASAANTSENITDIGLTVNVTNGTAADGAPVIDVSVKIRPEALGFADKDGRKKGQLDIAIFCADEKERLLGESWNTVDLEMTPETFAKFQTTGLAYTGKVTVTEPPRYVKVVVYDAGADVVGSQMLKLEIPKVNK